MVEIDIPESTYVMLELIALADNITPEAVIDKMVSEYRTTGERELIAESARRLAAHRVRGGDQ